MNRKREIQMQNNRGISLVELVVTMAIVSIVSLGIVSFIITSYNQYRSQNSNINLQYEAQLAMNQLEDLILNASNGMSFDETTKTLTIYNQTEKTLEDGTVTYENVISVIAWDAADNQLKLSRYLYNPADGTRSVISENQLMAEYVSDFVVKLDDLESKHIVDVSLAFALDTKQYNTTKQMTIRNNIGRSTDGTAFVQMHAVNPAVATNVLVQPASMFVKRGTTAPSGFTTAVQGDNFPLQDVVWTISPTTEPDYPETTVVNPETGQLTIDGRETKAVFELVATTVTPSSSGDPITKSVSVYNVYANQVSLTLEPDAGEAKAIAKINVSGKNLTYADVSSGNIALAFYVKDSNDNPVLLSSSDIRVSGNYTKLDSEDGTRDALHYSVGFELQNAAYLDQKIYCVAKANGVGESAPAEILFESKAVKDARLILVDSSGNEPEDEKGVYTLCRDEKYKVGLEITYDDGKGTVEQIFAGNKKWEKYDWSASLGSGKAIDLASDGTFEISSGQFAWGNNYTINVSASSKLGGTDFSVAGEVNKVTLEIVERGSVGDKQKAFPLCTNGGNKTITFRLDGVSASSGYEVVLSSGTPEHIDVSCTSMEANISPKSKTDIGADTLKFTLKKGNSTYSDISTSITIVMGMPNLYKDVWGNRVNNNVYLFSSEQIVAYASDVSNGYYLLADTGSQNAKLVSVEKKKNQHGNATTYCTTYGGEKYEWRNGYGWNEFTNHYQYYSGWIKNY